jgi:hypothetical protein
MGARAVDWARLESVCTARYRGFESLPIRFREESPGNESALHTFRLIKYVVHDEMAPNFLVPRASSYGCGARFDFLRQPGGHWAGGGRIESSKSWGVGLLTTADRISKPSCRYAGEMHWKCVTRRFRYY